MGLTPLFLQVMLLQIQCMVVRNKSSSNHCKHHNTHSNTNHRQAVQQFQDPRYNQRYAQQPQPATQPAPPQNIPQVPVHRGPPLPPGGLPAGWSMDQWEYYGQQYLDRQQ